MYRFRLRRKPLKLRKAERALLTQECRSFEGVDALLKLLRHVTIVQIDRYESLLRQLCDADLNARGRPEDSGFMRLWDSFLGKATSAPGIFSVRAEFSKLVREAMAAIRAAGIAAKEAAGTEKSGPTLRVLAETIERYGKRIAEQAELYTVAFGWVDAQLDWAGLGDYVPRRHSQASEG